MYSYSVLLVMRFLYQERITLKKDIDFDEREEALEETKNARQKKWMSL